MLEAFQQPHPATAHEPAVQSVPEAVHMEQRQREKKPVVRRDPPAGQQVYGIGGEIIVRQDRAF